MRRFTTSCFNNFDGSIYDPESELQMMGFRMYDTETGRFTTPDLLWSAFPSQSPYHYAYNSPLIFSDPSGLAPEKEKDSEELMGDEWNDPYVDNAMRPALQREIDFSIDRDWRLTQLQMSSRTAYFQMELREMWDWASMWAGAPGTGDSRSQKGYVPNGHLLHVISDENGTYPIVNFKGIEVNARSTQTLINNVSLFNETMSWAGVGAVLFPLAPGTIATQGIESATGLPLWLLDYRKAALIGAKSLGAARIGVKHWLQNIGNLERSTLIKNIESVGFKKVFDGLDMMHFDRGAMKIRLDPPQGRTTFNHMHLEYGGNNYDIYLNITNYKSPGAHIPIK